MKYTYDLNENGCLILTADAEEREIIRKVVEESGTTIAVEAEALEHLLSNSELDWITSEETGDLTDAPMLGLRDEEGEVLARWAFMDYQLRSFLQDLIDNGKAVFVS